LEGVNGNNRGRKLPPRPQPNPTIPRGKPPPPAPRGVVLPPSNFRLGFPPPAKAVRAAADPAPAAERQREAERAQGRSAPGCLRNHKPKKGSARGSGGGLPLAPLFRRFGTENSPPAACNTCFPVARIGQSPCTPLQIAADTPGNRSGFAWTLSGSRGQGVGPRTRYKRSQAGCRGVGKAPGHC
jgi:hypothetical protein